MKRIFFLALSLILAASFCGCSRSDWGHISLPWAPTEAADRDVVWATGDPNVPRETQPAPEEIVREQLAPYLDVTPYEDSSYLGPVLPDPVREIRVHGVRLRIGMGYEEIVAAGFLPQIEDLAQSETEGMLVAFDFTAPNGKTVSLDLWGPRGSTYGESILRSVQTQGKDMDFHVEGIGENFTLEMILDALGAPTGLRINASRGGSNVVLEYRFKEANGCLQFVIDPEDRSIIRVDLWGDY